jgi:uncharacterized membrane protein YfcA
MELNGLTLLYLGAISALSGFLQSVVGFGCGIIVLALGSLVLAPKEVSVIAAFAALALNSLVLYRLRAHLMWDSLLPVILAVMFGAPMGVFFLKQASIEAFSLILGIVLLVSVVQQALPERSQQPWHPIKLGVPCGLLSGFLAGSFGAGGPPLVAFVATQGFDRFRMVVTLQLLLLIGALVRTEELWRQGLLESRYLLPIVTGIVCCLLGSAVGLRVLHRLPERLFRKLTAGFLLLLGIKYIAEWLVQAV